MRLIHTMLLAGLLGLSLAPQAADAKGGKDHPLLSRYAGSQLIAQSAEEYAELEIVQSGKMPAANSGRRYGDAKVGGRLTTTAYLAPAKRTPLEVFRNYEQALKQGGFELLYKCELQACADRQLTGYGRYAGMLVNNRLQDWVETAPSAEWTDNPSYFLSARLKRASGDAYVALWVTPGFAGGPRAGVFQSVLEAKPADTGLVKVDAAALGRGLGSEGRIALYGILFDTGRAELKPESKPQLEEMAKLLKQDAKLKVFIVGHTDNQGQLDANLALSQKRAEAVAAALSRDFGIDAKRLAARGVANFSPLASNRDEAGRGRNRRVELVEQ